ncbi:XisI protein [Spirulina subsalsa FACHB-351]|uniref:XisI protein n=1 Tax=Spirulina subsalsa FACHB-351 TaxID=234711 RepID=A0ABT3LBU8_9CYAN|nr:XisI protein [Spirulina subsalsa]MCW6038607.1 XisI protein [Spirulina subsalsa FACHB-351]
MDKLEHYRHCIKTVLRSHSLPSINTPDLESQLIFDQEGDHYLWIEVGWNDLEYVHACFLHLDIKEGKIWIQRNRTETDVAEALVEMGVAKSDIVLGLHPPYKRPYTGYGMAEPQKTPASLKP